jgi:hypothetical protein
MTQIVSSLGEISDHYDVVLCDVWGCVHNGREAFPDAVHALQAFRQKGGTVVLLTNAPRGRHEVAKQLDRIGVPRDSWDVVTTSGVATGQEADDAKITDFRAGIGDRPLALASGVTPENALRYKDVDAFLVATGINKPGDFYTIDPARLAALMRVTREIGAGE